MTSAPHAPEPESLVLRHLQALRREIALNNEILQTVLKHLVRQSDRLGEHTDHMNELSKKVDRIALDVAALELSDISRHGELLAVLRKLAHVHEEGAGPGDFA